MHAGADRVRLLREKSSTRDHVSASGRRFCDHCLGVGVVPAVQFLGQLEQPGPAVGPLERLSDCGAEVVGLGLAGSRPSGGRPSTARISLLLRQVGEQAQQPHEHPVAVDGRMPVEAAVERRVQCPRVFTSSGPSRTCPGLLGYSLPMPLRASWAKLDACFGLSVMVVFPGVWANGVGA